MGPITELHVMTDRCIFTSVQSESSTWFPGKPQTGGSWQEEPYVNPRCHSNRYRRLQAEGTGVAMCLPASVPVCLPVPVCPPVCLPVCTYLCICMISWCMYWYNQVHVPTDSLWWLVTAVWCVVWQRSQWPSSCGLVSAHRTPPGATSRSDRQATNG